MRDSPAIATDADADADPRKLGSGSRVLTSRPISNDAKQWSSFCSRAKVGRGDGGRKEGRYVVRAEATLIR